MSEQGFVIVGASFAGAKAAETLRAEGFDGRVVLVGEESDLPYERPPLSKGYLLGNDPRESAFPHDAAWYADQRVELLLGHAATAVDRASKTVALADGSSVGYDKLLLATGSRVRRLDLPGADLPHVRYLRRIEESEALKAAFAERPRVVVVGAGWIGLETAAAARTAGCEVTVVELDTLPLRRVLGDEVAAVFRDLHTDHGVAFRFGVKTREIRPDGVVLETGEELPAGLVVVGVGIQPNVELAGAAGLAVDNGVVTDAGLRTSDPDIYACGDVASWEHPGLKRHLRVEHWANALNGGPAAAKAMLGRDVTYDPVPYFFTDQYDLGMEFAGWFEPGGYERVVFRGDPATREFVAFWTAGGQVLAGMNVNVWDVTDDIQAIVRAGWAGTTVDTDRLTDPDVPLADLHA
ncbi:NAD(P)/FAD-dependent oxidoreductase [Virgisporangium ochraceum]|uniref:Ferredoxin n=1 Tax=Virgisporangium ochraceum TaxID=65505 RepID=A0A8J3ZY62_9ACTN|nr:FAD-dependent oxidoreductase [Virgisporangium ochraceum]GIJ71791.1 ferredoxin [Virgisporangium ochraceum]